MILAIGSSCCAAANAGQPVEVVSGMDEFSQASVEAATKEGNPGIVVKFTGTDDLHFYADGDMALKLTPKADGVVFGAPVWPKPGQFYDEYEKKNIDVFLKAFEVFIPVESGGGEKDVTVAIAGLACTSQACLPPFEASATAKVDLGEVKAAVEPKPAVENIEPAVKDVKATSSSMATTFSKLFAALLGGILFPLMPCVWPVIPIIVMQLTGQAKESASKRYALGGALCLGIILFFAMFAIFAGALKYFTGAEIAMNDYLRYPKIAAGLFLGLVVFAMIMLDALVLTVPASVASKSSSGSGALGSMSTGFLAAVLSVPCTGAAIGGVLVWVQTQPTMISILTFILMGVGMSIPYALLVVFPQLLNKMPKPGTWMEIFKKAVGFIFIFAAVKLMLPALNADQIIELLLFATVLSFAIWMWGSWVGFMTPPKTKWTVRILALIVIIAGWYLFMPNLDTEVQDGSSAPAGSAMKAGDLINWQHYNQAVIDEAVAAKQPVLIKFTATWCTNCKVVNKRVYKDAEIAKLIESKGVLAIKGDTTTRHLPADVALREVFGIPGTIPITILLMPDGTKNELPAIFDKEELEVILNTL